MIHNDDIKKFKNLVRSKISTSSNKIIDKYDFVNFIDLLSKNLDNNDEINKIIEIIGEDRFKMYFRKKKLDNMKK